MRGSQRAQRCEDRSERVEKIFDRKFLERMHIINRRGTIEVVRVSDRNSVSKFELMNEVMRQKFISTRVSKMQTQRVRESKSLTRSVEWVRDRTERWRIITGDARIATSAAT